MLLVKGQTIHNRYRIVSLLGQGGFGAVYRAWDLSLNKVCAIKENLYASPEAGRQFQREATMLASLQHPNLPRVTDYFFLVGQGQYLVMDLIEGEDLQTMLDRLSQPLPEAQALNWIGQICDALAYLHSQSQPIIHRDLKPANIKITPQGKAVLVDFGIAKIYNAHTQTTVAARAVTPGYSPPEQYDHTALTDARSDIYALGATLYTLLTKHEPLPSIQRLSANLPTPRSLNPNISLHVEQAILTAMEMQAARRYSNAKQFHNSFDVSRRSNKISTPLQATLPAPVNPSALKGLSLDQKLDIVGIFLILAGILILLALLSPVNSSITAPILKLLSQLFGYGKYLVSIGLIIIGLWIASHNFGDSLPRIAVRRIVGWVGVYIVTLVTLHFIVTPDISSMIRLAEEGGGGGYIGASLLKMMFNNLGQIGSLAVIVAGWIICLILGVGITTQQIENVIRFVINRLSK